ncbi:MULTISPECIES: hypothetical protein [Bacteroidales]|jgi:hypothetical protein|uniref:hypothetical protein n=1 Tax=Bacteroidales TaxID=171549 RepID=UPI000B55C86E|nr:MULTISPECIES: hypothetical protein [Bacteroidales]MCL1609461.1 hypothetical protein [Marseilla massiliensis]OUP28867.1 hypothetical protein B5F25_17045 [Bacteroides sp. An19]
MKKIILFATLFISAININADNLKEQLQKQNARLDAIESDINRLNNSIKQQHRINLRLSATDKKIILTQDSIQGNLGTLNERIIAVEKTQSEDRISFKNDIRETNTNIATNLVKMDSRTMWGGILLFCTILGFSGYLYVKRRKDYTSMSEVRKAQEALRIAQSKMQEDSVKLDNQMLALMEKQMNATSTIVSTEADHSLALKVADEIVRIELNLSRMDASVKGYKQLAKAVERIKNNFQANGYEIIDMLGKPYNEGMKVVANFVPDETLKEGEQIITGVTKPQINYNGKMIQSAQITVSQNI